MGKIHLEDDSENGINILKTRAENWGNSLILDCSISFPMLCLTVLNKNYAAFGEMEEDKTSKLITELT